ncbi:CPBP family intramembrane glutamic endopeptidase [Lactococcus lactis]|uniref:CPBP family intramembrane metalloprotease n=1 Tax=Lactococcus lactis TaxID=1358 RepID=A0AAP4DTJ6_9LACT|nr:type II CAAX endopeptidase family protein [Lactococcus lactis]MDG4968902.1 CPBP family intramembrane metalloprotease [Lactococcus lactis]MDG4975721.1 CPBP family intramembrane metalloprotease [Lactococcus lactis]MDG5102997.1 CPBP family intramembrane metalloprotease [Lactococcus lactis]RHJ27057.1 CPBP family intramembrane metalloprotease [Lactococcus lactis]
MKTIKKYKLNLFYLLLFVLLHTLYKIPGYLVFAYYLDNPLILPFTDFLYTNSALAFPILLTLVAVIVIIISYYLGFFKNTFEGWSTIRVFKLLVILFVLLLLIYFTNVLMIRLGFSSSNHVGRSQNYLITMPKVMQYYIIGIVAPIIEEILWRVFLFKAVGNKNLALFISWPLFAFAHTGLSLEIIPYLLLSFIVTWTYYRNENVIESIFIHASYNLLSPLSAQFLNSFFHFIV